MNSYKKLFDNSIVFTLGNLGSKLITIILVPLYTYRLTTSEYGTVDIIQTTASLLIPMISLSVYEGLLRFIMDKQLDRKKVTTNSMLITIIGILFVSAVFLMFFVVSGFSVNSVVLYLYLTVIFQLIETTLGQFIRAVGLIKLFAIKGILLAFLTAGLNFVFLFLLDLSISGYFLSILISNILVIILMIYKSKIISQLQLSSIDKYTLSSLLKFSIPLIPNALLWWIMNASNRYLIGYFHGVSFNGLFAVANKIPSFIQIFTTIFSQAWQLSAIEEYDSKSRNGFYSKVFTAYSSGLIILSSFVLVILKPTISLLISDEYYESWIAVPFLILSVIFSSFSVFLGTNYIVAKKTSGVMSTTVYGAIANLILAMLLVPNFGILGGSLANCIGAFLVWIIRIKDTKKYIDMKFNWKITAFNLCVFLIQTLVLFLQVNWIVEILLLFCLFGMLLLGNRKMIISSFGLLVKFLRK